MNSVRSGSVAYTVGWRGRLCCSSPSLLLRELTLVPHQHTRIHVVHSFIFFFCSGVSHAETLFSRRDDWLLQEKQTRCAATKSHARWGDGHVTLYDFVSVRILFLYLLCLEFGILLRAGPWMLSGVVQATNSLPADTLT